MGQEHSHGHGHHHGHGHGPQHDHHEHGHSHAHHGHSHAPTHFGRAFAIGIALNTGFVALEAALGFSANSLALLADAAHNLSDVFSLLLAWLAMRLSQRLPSLRFTYGLRGSSILAALVNAGSLLVLTGALAWEALRRLPDAGPVQGGVVIGAALAGVVVNGATAWLFMRGSKDDLNIRGAYLHMAADAAVSLAVAIGGVLVLATGWNVIDPLLTLAVSAFIVWSTWGLLRQSLGLALQAVPAGIDPLRVREMLGALPGVREVHDLHVWAMSTTENALTAHLVIPGHHPGDAFLHEACRRLREDFGIQHATLQIELADTATPCALAPEHVV